MMWDGCVGSIVGGKEFRSIWSVELLDISQYRCIVLDTKGI